MDIFKEVNSYYKIAKKSVALIYNTAREDRRSYFYSPSGNVCARVCASQAKFILKIGNSVFG